MAGKPNTSWMKTMVAKYGSRDAVSKAMAILGAKGGSAGNTGGFATNRELAIKAAKIGGARSKRGYRFLEETKSKYIYKRLSDGEIVMFSK